MADTRLTNTELTVLKDCAGYKVGHYVWKPATMRKLAAKGLVSECNHALRRDDGVENDRRRPRRPGGGHGMNHCMIDLETMGTSPGCAIASIGAVIFDPERPHDGSTAPEFYAVVDLASCQSVGLTMDAGTVYWWLTQSQKAREAVCRAYKRLGLVKGMTDAAAVERKCAQDLFGDL